MTEMETVVLGLGSNRDSEDLTSMQILSGACRALSGFVNIRSWSGVYRTKAMYYENQNDFLNMVVCAETDLSPHRLLDKFILSRPALAETGRLKSETDREHLI